MRNLWAAVIVVAAVAAVLMLYGRLTDIQTKWEAHVIAAQSFARKEMARADSLVAVADSVEADAAERARLAFERGRRTRQRVVEVREVVVPDTCAPFIAVRDSIIDALVVEADEYRSAYTEQVAVSDRLRLANASLLAGIDSLNSVLDHRPKSRRWLPRPGVGVFGGMCADGPCYGVGLTLSWPIP